MHPEVYAEYKGLVDQFKAEGWGIYDESPELHRAIAYSDAYYGDLSSVVTLYNQTGKNIVIQKFGAIQFEDYYLLDTEIVMAQNGQAYIFNNVDSVLYKVDCKSGILSSVTQFGSGYYLGYITAAILTNKIIAFPYLEKDKAVYEYDLYLREKKNIKIPGLSIKNYPLLYECVQNESYIVAYGTKSKIFIYDVKQEKYSCYQEWKYQLAGKVADIDNILLGRGVLKNNILVMPVKFTNLVLENVLPYTSEGRFYLYVNDLLTEDTENEPVTRGTPTCDMGEHDFQVNGELYVDDTNRENRKEIIVFENIIDKEKLIIQICRKDIKILDK